MTIATLREVLLSAIESKSAVAGLVVLGWEDARAYVEAAEELKLPIILQAGPSCRAYMPIAILGKMFRHLAEQATIPIVCHVDHALTLEECIQGIEAGFSSVMIDGSKLPLSENIELTKSVVEKARKAGVSVEGEVGTVGYSNGAVSTRTIPEEAWKFENETGVDALAVSIGNLHLSAEKSAKIDLDLLGAIAIATNCPLVLHGGSGIPTELRRNMAKNFRVKKFNVGTELRIEFGQSLRKSLLDQPTEFDRLKLLSPTIPILRNAATKIIAQLAS
jgi:fructose-bisphosphate aldolase, class II